MSISTSSIRTDDQIRMDSSQPFSNLCALFGIAVHEVDLSEKLIKAIIDNPKKVGPQHKKELEELKDNKNQTLLMRAIQCNQNDLIDFLIEKRIALHAKDSEGNTALHIAAQKEDPQLIVNLAEHINILEVNSTANLPLHLTIKAGCIENLKWFKKHQGWETKLKEDGYELHPIHIAIKYGQQSCLEVLLDPRTFICSLNNVGNLLHVATQFKQPFLVDYLLYATKISECLKENKRTIKEYINEKNNLGQSPLSLAAALGEDLSLHLLFCKGANIESEDTRRRRPLHHAVLGRRFDTVKLLVKLGAQPEIVDGDLHSPMVYVKDDNEGDGKSIHSYLTLQSWKELPPGSIFRQELPQNLVFKGGGPKGIAYAGSLEALEQDQILGHIKRVAGTSAGAITAVLIALGYTITEIKQELLKTKIVEWLDAPEGPESFMALVKNKGSFISKAWDFLRTFRSSAQILLDPIGTIDALINLTGICPGNTFLDWVKDRIKEKTGDPLFTFGELRKAIEVEGKKKFRHLTMYATLLNSAKERSIYKFSSEDKSCDDIIIAHALRCSMSIPGVFKPHIIYKKRITKRSLSLAMGNF